MTARSTTGIPRNGIEIAGDRALEGRQRVGIVDHDHGGGAGLLAEFGTGHTCTDAAQRHDDVAGLYGGVLRRLAPSAMAAPSRRTRNGPVTGRPADARWR